MGVELFYSQVKLISLHGESWQEEMIPHHIDPRCARSITTLGRLNWNQANCEWSANHLVGPTKVQGSARPLGDLGHVLRAWGPDLRPKSIIELEYQDPTLKDMLILYHGPLAQLLLPRYPNWTISRFGNMKRKKVETYMLALTIQDTCL